MQFKAAILALQIVLLALVTYAAKKKSVVMVPGHCVNVDKFYGVCTQSKEAGFDCHIHMKIQPLPECNQYNTQEVLQVMQ